MKTMKIMCFENLDAYDNIPLKFAYGYHFQVALKELP